MNHYYLTLALLLACLNFGFGLECKTVNITDISSLNITERNVFRDALPLQECESATKCFKVNDWRYGSSTMMTAHCDEAGACDTIMKPGRNMCAIDELSRTGASHPLERGSPEYLDWKKNYVSRTIRFSCCDTDGCEESARDWSLYLNSRFPIPRGVRIDNRWMCNIDNDYNLYLRIAI